VLFEGVAARLTTQIVVKVLLAPFVGMLLVETCRHALQERDVQLGAYLQWLPMKDLWLNDTTGAGLRLCLCVCLCVTCDAVSTAWH